MTTKIKTTLLTAFFFFGLMTVLQAQDKYDFAIVNLDNEKNPVVIRIIQNDMPVKIIDTGKKIGDIDELNERLLNTISQLTTEGWEVINAARVSGLNTFYLKRKRK